MHHRQAIAESQGLLPIVGHQQKRYPHLPLDALQFAAHAAAQLGVEGGQWFIQQQCRRGVHQGPGQGHPLLLAA